MARISAYPTSFWRAVRKKQEIYRTAQQHKLAHRKDVQPGVLVFHLASDRDTANPKLSPRFEGPYRVLQVKNNKALCRCLATFSQSWFHFDSLKLSRKHYEDEFFRANPSDHGVSVSTEGPLPAHIPHPTRVRRLTAHQLPRKTRSDSRGHRHRLLRRQLRGGLDQP